MHSVVKVVIMSGRHSNLNVYRRTDNTLLRVFYSNRPSRNKNRDIYTKNLKQKLAVAKHKLTWLSASAVVMVDICISC